MDTMTNRPASQADDARELDLATFAARAAHTQRRQEPTPNRDGVRVGDLFFDIWGYEQTNIDFYEVVALAGKCTAVLRKVAGEYIGGYQWTGETRACRGQYVGEPFRVRTGTNTFCSAPEPYCNSPRHGGGWMSPTTDDRRHGYSTNY